MPKQLHMIKDFIQKVRRKDARSVQIKVTKHTVKFKVRCSKYLYTLCLHDFEKACRLREAIPPGLPVEII